MDGAKEFSDFLHFFFSPVTSAVFHLAAATAAKSNEFNIGMSVCVLFVDTTNFRWFHESFSHDGRMWIAFFTFFALTLRISFHNPHSLSLSSAYTFSTLGLIEHCRLSGIHIYELKMAWAFRTNNKSSRLFLSRSRCLSAYQIDGGGVGNGSGKHIGHILHMFARYVYACLPATVCVQSSILSMNCIHSSILMDEVLLPLMPNACCVYDVHFAASVFAIYSKALMLFSFEQSTCSTV